MLEPARNPREPMEPCRGCHGAGRYEPTYPGEVSSPCQVCEGTGDSGERSTLADLVSAQAVADMEREAAGQDVARALALRAESIEALTAAYDREREADEAVFKAEARLRQYFDCI